MTYEWFPVFNLAEFNALDIPSKAYELLLEGIGLKTILAVKGVGVGFVYEDIFLRINLNEENPFTFENHAIYLDGAEQVWLGILAS